MTEHHQWARKMNLPRVVNRQLDQYGDESRNKPILSLLSTHMGVMKSIH